MEGGGLPRGKQVAISQIHSDMGSKCSIFQGIRIVGLALGVQGSDPCSVEKHRSDVEKVQSLALKEMGLLKKWIVVV